MECSKAAHILIIVPKIEVGSIVDPGLVTTVHIPSLTCRIRVDYFEYHSLEEEQRNKPYQS